MISSRRRGPLHSGGQSDLASEYAAVLRRLENKCKNDPSFSLDVLGYVNDLQFSINSTKDSYQNQDNEQNNHSQRSTEFNEEQSSEEEEEEDQSEGNNEHQISEPWMGTAERDNHETLATEPLTDRQIQPSPSFELKRPVLVPQIPSQSQFDIYNSASFSTLAEPIQSFENAPTTLDASQQMTSTLASAGGFEDFNSLSPILFDQQYLEMDRIISFDDGIFAASMDWWHSNQGQF